MQKTSETQTKSTIVDHMSPHILVYKTKANCVNLAPIILSDDKTTIVSYPHPEDIKTDRGYLLPTFLNSGYLLDNKGIGKNVAFLKIAYEEYAKLQNAPSLIELYELITDKDPLIELYDCGIKTALPDVEIIRLNKLIDNNSLRITCKLIK